MVTAGRAKLLSAAATRIDARRPEQQFKTNGRR